MCLDGSSFYQFSMAHVKSQPKATLCRFCSSINFDLIRLPTAGELRQLSAGLDVTGQYPFKRHLKGPIEWQLGSMKRIQESASSCSLCACISSLYDEVQRAKQHVTSDMVCNALLAIRGYFKPRNINNVAPSVLEYMGVKQPQDLAFSFRSLTITWSDAKAKSETFFSNVIYANHAFHAYDIQHSASPLTLFKDETIPDDGLLLCGRVTKPRIRPEIFHAWMGECTEKHGARCGTISATQFVVRTGIDE